MSSSSRWVLAFALGAAGVVGSTGVAVAVPSMRALQAQVESTMQVRGSIQIGADGRVRALQLSQEENIPPGVASFVKESIAGWEFEPTLRNGQPVAITTPVNLRLVGRTFDDGSARIEIRHASFVAFDKDDPAQIARLSGSTPTFPVRKVGNEAAADVFLLVQVGRDGKVLNAVAEQVNLRVLVSPRALEETRKAFAGSALQAVQDWTFRVPSAGPAADRQNWVVRVPVRYGLRSRPVQGPAWEPYLPGPRQRAPWMQPEPREIAPDALGEGVYLVGGDAGPVLKTALGSS